MKNYLQLVSAFGILLFLGACDVNVEGDEICGIWNAKTPTEMLQLEIMPKGGKFVAYLRSNEEVKEQPFMTHLEFVDETYKNGRIHGHPNSDNICQIQLEMLDEHHIKAKYNCGIRGAQEAWTREGHEPLPALPSLREQMLNQKKGIAPVNRQQIEIRNSEVLNEARSTPPSPPKTSEKQN